MLLACAASPHPLPVRCSHDRDDATPSQQFDAFARNYFDTRFRYLPTEATNTGVHTFDGALEDMSPAAVTTYGHWLASERDELDRMIPNLPEQQPGARAPASDRPRLDAVILRETRSTSREKRLIEWNELATHPGTFHQLAADTVYQLMVRDFAPIDVRVRNAIARLHAIPALLAAGEHWLTNPPHLAVEVALREINGSIEMIRDIFPTFAQRATDPALRDQARQAATEAATALQHHRDYLQNTLLPRATGDYHDGREHWNLRARL